MITKEEMLEDIRRGLQVTEDLQKRAWLLGAETAIMTLNAPEETMLFCVWHNEISMMAGVN